MSTICRPEKLTCRWIKEMTEAIRMACPVGSPDPVLVCNHPEQVWTEYLTKLEQGQCIQQSPEVRQMLAFELDYNDVRSRR